MKLAFIGVGGHFNCIFDCIEEPIKEIYLFDTFQRVKEINGMVYQVRHPDFIGDVPHSVKFIIAIGDIQTRKHFIKKVSNFGYQFATVIAKEAIVSKDAVLMEGVFVGKGAIIDCKTEIGSNSIVSMGAVVSHDTVIGRNTNIAPNATVLGHITIGNHTLIGGNSSILPTLSIGNNCRIGAGTVVLSDVPNNTTAVGIYKKGE